jgi:DNA-binding SARP family transcriptional activator
MTIDLILFGKPRIVYDGDEIDLSVKKAVAMLAYLATTGRAHSRERLATLLWPDSRGDVARTSLRQAMRALRATPIAKALETSRETIALGPDFKSDVQAFMGYTRSIDYEKATLTLDEAARLQAAEGLYTDDFLADFNVTGSAEWDDWQQLRRIEFQYQATRVIAALTRYYAQQERTDSGLKMAKRWLDMDPFNDEAHYLTMHLYVISGQAQLALEQYHLLVRLMAREHGRAPDSRIRQLYEQIRQGNYLPLAEEQSDTEAIRSLLPRPMPRTPVQVNQQQYNALKGAVSNTNHHKTTQAVLLDEENRAASAMIAALAHDTDIQQQFTDGILWGRLDTDADLEHVLRLWLDAMRVSILRSTSKLEHLTWQFHNGQRDKRLLFLLENVPNSRYAALLTPGYAGCALVITTTHRDVAQDLMTHRAKVITLSTS